MRIIISQLPRESAMTSNLLLHLASLITWPVLQFGGNEEKMVDDKDRDIPLEKIIEHSYLWEGTDPGT